MSKRAAEKQLTSDNWDEDDSQPEEAVGRFTAAPQHVLQSRKIRVAARRKPRLDTEDSSQEKKGIFAGFGGFTKTSTSSKTPSFDFISNFVSGKKDESVVKTSFTFNLTSNASKSKIDTEIGKTSTLTEKNNNTNIFSIKNDSEKNKKEVDSLNTTSGSLENESLKKNEEYYVNLKNLNISVSEWIKSHVDKNPYCILTPIFNDYIDHLRELEKLKRKTKSIEETKDSHVPVFSFVNNSVDKANEKSDKTLLDKRSIDESSTSGIIVSPLKTKSESDISIKSPIGNIFGGNTSSPGSKPPMFSFMQKTDTATSTSYTFGTGEPFKFGNLVQTQPTEAPPPRTNGEDEEDEPPKTVFTPVVEEDNVYSKRCKVFVKKDDTFGDRGVGVLYIKPIKDGDKYQVIVRADTSLGNLLLNIVLSDIPMQRMGKNNVMFVCIPTTDGPQNPVPVLLRVKTGEEADELLETMNKYKK